MALPLSLCRPRKVLPQGWALAEPMFDDERARVRLDMSEIVEPQVERLRARLAARKLGLELTEVAKKAIAEAGWDPAYGARPLKRALQRLVENPLALKLLEGEFAEDDTVRVDATGGELVFERTATDVAV